MQRVKRLSKSNWGAFFVPGIRKEIAMLSKKTLMSASWVIGIVFAVSIIIGLSGNITMAGGVVEPDLCGNNDEYTSDFRLGDCKFKTVGQNPFFVLRPGYRLVLETPEGEDEREKSVETVLRETKWINLDGRKIRTRVLEERAFEWDENEEEWVTIEISLNYFAICKKTNAVYYFGEWSRDCEDGFDDDDICEGEESNPGSWEAGINGALPGLMMPGTALLGAKYFQEIAPPDATDRGAIAEMGLEWPEEGETEFTDCILIFDTNPAEGECGEDDSKIYCPGVGLVQDQDLELVSYGYVDGDDD
jgi:hypothetical protein